MSLTGSLSTMPLAEVLGWIAATNRVGVLTVRGADSETLLRLRRGRIVECAAVESPVLLGQFLLFHGLIEEDALDQAMRAHVAQGRRLGDVLLASGAVGSENLQEALTAKAEETVLCSFDHPTGWFAFDPDATSLQNPLPLDMSITDAIARGQERVKTAAVAVAALMRTGSVLRKTSKRPSAKLSAVRPLRDVYMLVDGERSIAEIVLHVHGTEYHVVQRLYQLCLEGFIELVDADEPPPSNDLQFATSTIEADSERTKSSESLDGVIPLAIRPEFVRQSRSLTIIERYILSRCDGTRDLRRITSVAPIQPRVVMDTVQSLKNRGWLEMRTTTSDCE